MIIDENTKNLINVSLGLAQFLVVLCGAAWAYYRFRAEGLHRPRVEFDVDANFLGPQNNYFLTEILISAHNVGLRIRKFPSIKLLVRGIRHDATIEKWKGNEPRLFFPDKIIDNAEVVFKKNYSHVFVEPGVKQKLTYLTRIPTEYRFISIRVEFEYDEGRTHSAERMLELPTKRIDSKNKVATDADN